MIEEKQWNELENWQKSLFENKVCLKYHNKKYPEYSDILSFLLGYEIGDIEPEANIDLLWNKTKEILNAGKQ